MNKQKEYTNVEDAVDRLLDLARLEGSELAEMWHRLAGLWDISEYLHPFFRATLENEILDEANISLKHFEIVEEERTYTEIVKGLKRLDDEDEQNNKKHSRG